jgi:hypothetical protein
MVMCGKGEIGEQQEHQAMLPAPAFAEPALQLAPGGDLA